MKRIKREYFIRSRKSDSKSEEKFLKLLAFASNSIPFLPVFLASDPTEDELRLRASSVEIITPGLLNRPLSTVAQTDSDQMPNPALDAFELEEQAETFKATLLWEKIVVHLERSVKRGKRSHGLRTFQNCFPGTKAVDCLTVYLNTILPKTVKRSQVQVLCQKLLLTNVIEDVRSKEKTAFREGRLYRFTGNHFWEGGHDVVSSSQDEVGGLSKSASVENVMKQSRRAKWTSHSKGYTSDSTIAPSPHVVRKRHRATTATNPLACKTMHPKGEHSSEIARNKTSQVKSASNPSARSSILVEKGRRTVPESGQISRRFTFLRRDRHRVRVSPPAQTSCAPPSQKDTVRDKRYSLQMKGTKQRRERDFTLQSYQREVRQRMLIFNTGIMHRSHSFSSSLSTNSDCGNCERKWVVYGFV